MGQPEGEPQETPLIEGVDPSWNSVVSHIPEDKRPEIAPTIQQYHQQLEDLRNNYKPWEELTNSGIDADYAQRAITIVDAIENQPHMVYERLHNYLYPNGTQGQGNNVNNTGTGSEETGNEPTGQQTQQTQSQDPTIQQMQTQLNTLAQIALAQKEEKQTQQQQAEEDAALDREIIQLKEKHGDFPENEVLMRAYYARDVLGKDMNLEEAYQEYSNVVGEAQKRRPAPFLLGGGSGQIPKPSVDPGKLDSKGTKDLVTQMLNHANAERSG